MAETHEGGCHCRAVRYRVVENPCRVVVCHCTSCQRRTGSAFGISVVFAEQDVEITQGVLTSYEYRSDESHRWLKTAFCPTCATTVTFTAEAVPGMRGINGGTFDDPNWFHISSHIWTRSAHHWMVFPADVELIETTK